MTALISCVVAVFNGERYLAEALESILAQTYGALDVIVIDDGSTDGTPDVVASFARRVRSVRQRNAGPAAARNRGVAEARGELIAFLDADDLWHPDKLARQAARFLARPELDVSLTQIQHFWAPELAEEEARCRQLRIAQPAPGYLTAALLARRAVFDRVGGFEESWSHVHDTEWFSRLRDRGVEIEMLPEALVHRRLHPHNRSRLLAEASREEYLRWLGTRVRRDRQ